MFPMYKLMDDFVAGLNEKFPDFTFTMEAGRKYHRVVVQHTKFTPAETAQRSVYCFLDPKTHVLKAAGWAKPAKGSRAHLEWEGVEAVVAKAAPYGRWLYKH